MMNRKKILVADDEPKLLKFLSGFLEREGFEVAAAMDGWDVIDKYISYKPDLIVLDVMMPKMDGFEVCRRIRQESNVPVIFLSARGETMDRVMGLTFGSDDYLTKPFDSAELLLRIRAVLRRAETKPLGINQGYTISFPGLIINRNSRVVEVDGRETELTAREFDLLWLLAGHPNQVFTRNQILYQVWGEDYGEDTTGVITTLVKRLREKIEDDPAKPVIIKTIRGVGYKFGLKPC